MRTTDWSRYGTKCRICDAAPRSACLSTQVGINAPPTVPKSRPHDGRRVTERKPYPQEAAVRAAATRLKKQKRMKVETWKARGYRPSVERLRQIGVR